MSNKKIIPIYDLYKKLDSDKRFEFTLLEESYTPYDASAPHRHNYYEVLFFNNGGGNHEIDFNSFPIEKNSLHFISPEQVHLLRRNKNVTGFVISFTSEFFYEENIIPSLIESLPFFDNPSALPVIRLKDSSILDELSDLFSKIHSEYNSKTADSPSMLRLYLSLLLIVSKRSYKPESISGKSLQPRSELTRKFKKLVDNNFRLSKSVSDYAVMLNITPGHLNDTVQKDTGKTASDIIHERIILEAKRMLYHSPKSVKEIAFDLKYDDPSHFTRFFKTHASLTPEQFRIQIREKYQ